MVGLTQIGQVSSRIDSQTRRLLDALINSPDQWITAGSLAVHVSSAIIDSNDVKVTGDGNSRFTISPEEDFLTEWPADVVGAVVTVGSDKYVVVKRDSDTVVTVSAATNSISTATAGALDKPAPVSGRIGKIDLAAAEGANAGDILYYSSSVGQYVRLPIGDNSDVLTVAGGMPTWSADSSAGTVTSVGITGTDGIQVDSGSPIISTGTIQLGLANIANDKLANSAITVAAGDDNTAVSLGGTITFAGTANEVDVTESSGTVTIGLPTTIEANVTGNVTGSSGSCTGNAATVTNGVYTTDLASGVLTFLGTPSSANLAAAVSDETGSGSLVFATNPTLVTPALGTPSALVGTNISGTAASLTAGKVTVTDSTADTAFPVTFYNTSTLGLHRHTGGLTYNPSNLVRQISGPLSIVGLDSDHNATGNSLTIEGGHTVNGTTVDGTGLSSSSETESTFDVADATGIAVDDILSVGAENMTVTAINVGSNANRLTVDRNTSGTQGSHADGASLFLFNDVKGGDLVLRGGPGKGQSPGGSVKIQTTNPLGSTTTGLNSYADLDGILFDNVSISKPAQTEANMAGSNLTISAGQSTGSKSGGKLALSTSLQGSGGSSVNALTEGLVIAPKKDSGTEIQVGVGFDPSASAAMGPFTISGAPGTSDRYVFGMTKTYTDTSGHQSGAIFSVNASASGASTAKTFGLFMDCGTTSADTKDYTATSEAFVGGKFTVRHRGSGDVSNMTAAACGLAMEGADGDLDTAIGLSIDTMKKSRVTTGYGLRQGTGGSGTSDINFFAGAVRMGGTVEEPDTPLHVVGSITTEYSYATVDVPTSVPAGDLLNNAEVLGTAKAIAVSVGSSFHGSFTLADNVSLPHDLDLGNSAAFGPFNQDVAVYDPDGDFEVMTATAKDSTGASPDQLTVGTRNVNGGGNKNFGTSSEVRAVLHAPDASLPITVAIADTDGLETGVAKIVNSRTGHVEYVNISSVDPDVSVTVDARGLANSSKMYITGAPNGLETISMVKASPAVLPLNARVYTKNTYAKDHTEDSSESNIIIKSQSADLHPTAQTTKLAAAINSSVTTITVTDGDTSSFPSPSFNIRIGSEELTVTGVDGDENPDQWTGSLGQRSTIAQRHADEAVVTHQVDHDRYLYASLSKSPLSDAATQGTTDDSDTAVTVNGYHGTITIPVANVTADDGASGLGVTPSITNNPLGPFVVNNDRVKEGDVVIAAMSNGYYDNIANETVGPHTYVPGILIPHVYKIANGSFKILLLMPNTHLYSHCDVELQITFRVIPSSALLWNASTTEP